MQDTVKLVSSGHPIIRPLLYEQRPLGQVLVPLILRLYIYEGAGHLVVSQVFLYCSVRDHLSIPEVVAIDGFHCITVPQKLQERRIHLYLVAYNRCFYSLIHCYSVLVMTVRRVLSHT